MTTARLGIEISTTGANEAANNLDRVKTSSQQAEKAVENLGRDSKKSLDTLATSTRGASTNVTRLSTAMNNSRGTIQNLGFQVGDFATQVGSGTSAVIALGQQLPQALGAFGALGAVMGAVAAIAIPLGAALFRMAGAGGDLTTTIDDLNDAMDAYLKASENAQRSNADLVASFGAYTGQIRETLELQKELAKIEAVDELQRAGDLISETFGSMQQTIGRLAEISGVTPFTRIVEKLRYELGATESQATELADEFVKLGKAGSIEEQVTGYRAIREQIIEIVGGVENLNDENRELIKAILDAETATIGLTDEADNAETAFTRTVSTVRGLTDEIERAANASASLAESAAFSLTRAQIEQQYRTDPVGQAGALAGARYDERVGDTSATDPLLRGVLEAERAQIVQQAEEAARIREEIARQDAADREAAKPPRKKSRRSSGKTEAEREAETRNRVLEALRMEIDAYEQSEIIQRAANEARRAGVSLSSEYGQEIQGLVTDLEALAQAQERAEASSKFFGDTIRDAIQNFEDLGDVGVRALNKIGDAIIDNALEDVGKIFAQTTLGNILGSVLTNAKGNAFEGGNVIPFANGGVVGSPTYFGMSGGRTGLMGEAGPEGILPLSRGKDGKLGVQAEGAGTTINSTINITGESTREQKAAAAKEMIALIDQYAPVAVQNHNVRYG